jgi:hypothetical protein
MKTPLGVQVSVKSRIDNAVAKFQIKKSRLAGGLKLHVNWNNLLSLHIETNARRL